MIETLNVEAVDRALRTMIAPGGRVLGLGSVSPYQSALERIAHEFVCAHDSYGAEAEFGGRDVTVAVRYLQLFRDDADYASTVRWLAATLKPGGLLVVVDADPADETGSETLPRGYLPVLGDPSFANMQVMAGDFGGHWCAGFWKRDCLGITIPADSVLGPEGSIIGPEALTVERISGRIVLASATPPCVAIPRELMERARADGYLNRIGDMIHLRFDNARPIYRIIGWAGRGAVAVCERVEAA